MKCLEAALWVHFAMFLSLFCCQVLTEDVYFCRWANAAIDQILSNTGVVPNVRLSNLNKNCWINFLEK